MADHLDPQTTLVSDLCARGLCDEQVAVVVGTPFRDVVQAHRRQPACRTLAVVDDERVRGIIPVRLLQQAVFVDVFPGAALGEVDDLASALEVMHEMRHKTAGELMEDAQVVRLDDSLHDAFVRIDRAGVSGLPIVDAADRLTGYLDLGALAALWDTQQGAAETA